MQTRSCRWTENPHPEEVLLDGFRDYVLNDVEPSFSGPRNIATVGLINALGASSEQGVVIDFRRVHGRRIEGGTRAHVHCQVGVRGHRW